VSFPFGGFGIDLLFKRSTVMRNRIAIILVLAASVAILGIALVPTVTPAQDKRPMRTKWEYKIVKVSMTWDGKSPAQPGVISEAALSALGEEGWELDKITGGQPFVVSTRALPRTPESDVSPTVNTIGYSVTVYYFKRAK
jgi:hypothetical protein